MRKKNGGEVPESCKLVAAKVTFSKTVSPKVVFWTIVSRRVGCSDIVTGGCSHSFRIRVKSKISTTC